MPIIVQNMRLIFRDEATLQPLVFMATVKKIASDFERAFATQFPVRGRDAQLVICEFQREPAGRALTPGRHEMVLEARLGNKDKWQKLCRFPLNISEESAKTIKGAFTAHDNMSEE